MPKNVSVDEILLSSNFPIGASVGSVGSPELRAGPDAGMKSLDEHVSIRPPLGSSWPSDPTR
ncbi:hypothetical protein [Burkholderia vietnamiensis]|jgi:hypothetical protein|uniref:hypothetical protein n=1 Tax=Burkholderia vietnamiensis TaxID=60552 RepID=UPI001591424F|nr:hypothetical protein [Burkholderia vietnamiensis]